MAEPVIFTACATCGAAGSFFPWLFAGGAVGLAGLAVFSVWWRRRQNARLQRAVDQDLDPGYTEEILREIAEDLDA